MKKIRLLFLPLLLLALSCSQEEMLAPSAEQTQSPITASSEMRSIDDAIRIAQQAADAHAANSRNVRQRVDPASVSVITSRNSRSGSTDTLIYAVDFADEQGFALVSAPLCAEPLISIIEKGSYASSEVQSNPGFKYALAASEEYVKRQLAITIQPINPKPTWYYDTTTVYNKETPRVQVCWGQGWPENDLAPNKKAGCGPVAMAQVLSYFQLPTQIIYSYPGMEGYKNGLNWSNINKHKKSMLSENPSDETIADHYKQCSAPELDHLMITRLIRELGHLASCKYESYGTESNYTNVFSVMRSMLSSKAFKNGTSADNLFKDLKSNNKGVAIVRGDDSESKYGHIWVADAIWEYGTEIKFYSMGDEYGDNEYHLISTQGGISKLIHYNWGWDGYGNGYFLTSVFCPMEGSEYDSSKWVDYSNYKNNFVYLLIV